MAAKNKCTNCKKYFIKENMIKVTAGKFCTRDCLKSYGMNNPLSVIEKARKKQAKDDALSKQLFKASDIKLRKRSAQSAFNAFIRKRDEKLDCISCDKTSNWHGQWHAGHYKTVGARPDLRFHEDNCHRQCSICNNHLSGNIGEYKLNLIKRIGLERIALMDLVNNKKLTCEDYKAIELKYKSKLKQLMGEV